MPSRPENTERIDLRRQIGLTYLGLWAERLCLAFWPLWSAAVTFLAFIFMGLHEVLPLEVTWSVVVLTGILALFGLWYAARRFAKPTRLQALERIDAALPGRPIRAVRDKQAIGRSDAASEAIWQEYQRRMHERIKAARSIPPRVRLARFDPFGLRHVALLLFAVSMLFGSVWRLGTVSEISAPMAGSAQAAGPSWEGWIEPPRYTGLPAIYLNKREAGELSVPVGSEVTLRLYGDVGDVTVNETVSTRLGDIPSAASEEQSFRVQQDGRLGLTGTHPREWEISAIKDLPPMVEPTGPAEVAVGGVFTMPFEAMDDYSVAAGRVLIELDLPRVDRRYGLALEPEDTAPIEVPLPLPVTGSRDDFEETFQEDFSDHPWANLPVTITFFARDEAEQEGEGGPYEITLAARKFFNPVAAAVVELRRDLLWNRDNAPRIAQLMRAISHRPEGLFKREADYLKFRVILRRLETALADDGVSDTAQQELAEAMWELALALEDGNLADALERMRAAQEKLSEAMRNGASEEEIAELMQELREATDDYMNQLAQQQQQEGEENENAQQQGESMQLSQQDLQDMMDRIQELMEQGRMAEAEQALREFQQMMENMRVTQNQSGTGENPGQQAMEGLAETLRGQQGLSDEAFRDLQEQFNPDARSGQSGENEGRNGGEGRGEEHEGQGEGEGNAESGRDGRGEEDGEGQQGGGERSLAERQQELRRGLSEQERQLPQLGGEPGEAMREALEGAGRAMEEAEEALRENDLAEAIDRQAEAMDNLREGMDNLGESLAQSGEGQEGQDGRNAQASGRDGSDPLGRSRGGSSATGETLLQNEDVYRRARELLDEIRRRSGDSDRSEKERSYLRRLLDRFE